MAYKKVNPFDWAKDIGVWMKTVNDGGGIIQWLKSLVGLAPVMKTMTAETMANTLATTLNDEAKTKAALSSLGFTSSTQALTVAQRKQAIETLIANKATNGLKDEQIAAIAAMWGFKTSTDATTGSIKVLDTTTKSFMASNWVGWILAIVSVVVTLISVIVTLIDTTKNAAEATKEAMSAYAQAQDTLREHKKTIEDISKDYADLSDGVDKLGNNVSLTTEEYERYNEITNQIADMFPHLIAGYTDEGNAILTVKGNVEALTKAYEDEARAARDAVLAESKSVVENSNNTIKDTLWSDSDGSALLNKKYWGELLSLGFWQASASTTNLHSLGKYVDGDSSAFDDQKRSTKTTQISRVLQTLKDAGADVGYWEVWAGDEKTLQRVIKEQRDIVQSVINEVDQEIQTAASNNRSIIDAYLGNNTEYQGLDDKSKSLINQVVQNLDDEFMISFKSNTELFGWVQENLVGQFRDLDVDTQKQLGMSFDLMTQFNSGEITIEEYQTQIKSIMRLIDALNLDNEDEILKSFRIAFNIDDDGLVDASKQNVVKSLLSDEYDSMVSTLTKADLDIVDKNLSAWEIPDGTLLSWDELKKKISEAKALAWEAPADFEKISDGFDKIQDAYSTLNNAVTEYNDKGFLTLDNLQSLLSLEPEYLAALQMENGQLTINQGVLQNMIQTRLSEAKAAVIQSSMEQLHALAAKTAADAVSDNALAASNATAPLGNYASALGTVAKDAIVAAGAVNALNAAIAGAEENEFVDQAEIDTIISNMNNSLLMIDELGANLSTNFNTITGVDGGTGAGDGEDALKTQWDQLISKYENKLALITNERDLIQAEIDKAEARGGKASAKYYDDLIRNSTEEKTLLEEKQKALQAYLDANADAINEDTWTEYNNIINETAVAIKECEINTIEWKQALDEIDLHYFEQTTNELSRLGEELEFVNSLLEDDDVADENGNWSSAALTRMGIYTQQMELAAANAERYKAEIADLEREYQNGEKSEEEYQTRLSELIGAQQDAIMSYEDAKDGIVELNEARIDAIREGIDKEIEAYEDLIDAKKKELDAERDLYDFRNNIQDQTKNIAELERKIASLSGSSAASDVAERRKLEAQLLEAKEGLNDSYYDHSRDAQSQALDDEAEAYNKSKERYIEQLEQQLEETELIIQNSMMDVLLNADTVYAELNDLADLYGIELSDSLTQPWKDASAEATKWKNELQASMTSGEYAALVGEDGAITAFANNVATKLQGSWTKALDATKNYAGYLTGSEMGRAFTNTLTTFGNQIQTIINKWLGVKDAADDAYESAARAASVGGTGSTTSGSGSSSGGGSSYSAPKKYYVTAFLDMGGRSLSITKSASSASEAMSAARIAILGEYEKVKGNDISAESAWQRTWRNRVKYTTQYYAKGTTSVNKNGWAITDEPQFGDELVLVPTAQGTLSYMRKGTGIVPADLTANLMEWGQFSPDSFKFGGGVNVNMINNAVVQPQYDFSFDSLVHVDHCDQNTIKDLEKMVDNKIDKFSKELNYSIKRFAR